MFYFFVKKRKAQRGPEGPGGALRAPEGPRRGPPDPPGESWGPFKDPQRVLGFFPVFYRNKWKCSGFSFIPGFGGAPEIEGFLITNP